MFPAISSCPVLLLRRIYLPDSFLLLRKDSFTSVQAVPGSRTSPGEVSLLHNPIHMYPTLVLSATKDESWDSEGWPFFSCLFTFTQELSRKPLPSVSAWNIYAVWSLWRKLAKTHCTKCAYAHTHNTCMVISKQIETRVECSGSLPSMLDALHWKTSITKLIKQIDKKTAVYISSLTSNIALCLFIAKFKGHCSVFYIQLLYSMLVCILLTEV